MKNTPPRGVELTVKRDAALPSSSGWAPPLLALALQGLAADVATAISQRPVCNIYDEYLSIKAPQLLHRTSSCIAWAGYMIYMGKREANGCHREVRDRHRHHLGRDFTAKALISNQQCKHSVRS